MKCAIIDVYAVLKLFQKNPVVVRENIRNKYLKLNGITVEEILELIEKRKIAKGNKDYAAADEIRNTLISKGILIKDSSAGTDWDVEITLKK